MCAGDSCGKCGEPLDAICPVCYRELCADCDFEDAVDICKQCSGVKEDETWRVID
jgi:hypothetical protein